MTVQLSDTQRGLLSAAARRDDRVLVMPAGLKGGAAIKAAAKLQVAGFVREIAAKEGTPVWRRDSKTSQAFALKLTAAGLKASGHQPKENGSSESSTAEAGASKRKLGRSGAVDLEAPTSSECRPPREGSKIAQVVNLLQQEGGATIKELMKATGWLPHTTRAALTGLRKRGFKIERRERETGPDSYAIAALQPTAI